MLTKSRVFTKLFQISHTRIVILKGIFGKRKTDQLLLYPSLNVMAGTCK